MSRNKEKCIHGRNAAFCCQCAYGSLRSPQERHRDTVDEMNMAVGYKLKSGFAMQQRRWEDS